MGIEEMDPLLIGRKEEGQKRQLINAIISMVDKESKNFVIHFETLRFLQIIQPIMADMFTSRELKPCKIQLSGNYVYRLWFQNGSTIKFVWGYRELRGLKFDYLVFFEKLAIYDFRPGLIQEVLRNNG
jgi:hypothetical protein